MKSKKSAGAFLIMLILFIVGIAGAAMNNPQNVTPGTMAAPSGSGTDAINNQVFWSPGTPGNVTGSGLGDYSADRGTTTAAITISGGNYVMFTTPFLLPSRINNKKTSVRYV